MHYLTDKETTSAEWSAMIDGFQTESLAEQLSSVGASYFVITIGQAPGH